MRDGEEERRIRIKRRRGSDEEGRRVGEEERKREREEERKREGCKSKVELKRRGEEESRRLEEERRIDNSWRYRFRKSRPFIIMRDTGVTVKLFSKISFKLNSKIFGQNR